MLQDIDMELLRRLGVLRTACGSIDEPEGITRVRDAVRSVQERTGDAEPHVSAALDHLATVLGDEALTPELAAGLSDGVLLTIDALDKIATGEDDEASQAQLEAAWKTVGAPSDGATAPESVQDESEESADESLHSVASFLIQMEPTLMDSITILRDRFADTVGNWGGSSEVQEQLVEALEEIDAIAGNKRSKKTLRAAAVERVGAVIEVAMREEEDTMSPAPESDATDAPDLMQDEPLGGPFLDASSEVEDVVAEAGDPAAEALPLEDTSTEVTAGPAATSPMLDGAGDKRPGSLDSDSELVTDFVAEGLDYLDQAEEALLTLEANPSDQESVNVTFRAFHTIKGVSAFLELNQISGIAHEAETLLAQVREGSLNFTESAAELFLRSADVLRGLLEGVRELVGGGTATVPPGLEQLVSALSDPRLAEKVAGNESLGFQKATSETDEEDGPQAVAGEPAAGKPAASKADAAASGGDDSVRIRTERLDVLVDLVGELVVSYSMVSQDPDIVGNRGDLQKKVNHSSKIIRELQDLSTSLRMVPLKPAFHKISRVVRDVAKKSGKKVSLVAEGEETELDRSMVGVITDPLVHMVRNSIDHGVETPEERAELGKPPQGVVRLSAQQSGGSVVVTIEDDGRGLDKDKLLAKAVDRGLIDPDRNMSDSEIFNLIFHPGLSTAAKVTDISGRGVGMDVVKRAVESLRGRIEIESTVGKGTKFSIHLPLTLAITDGMLVRIGNERFIVPTMKIQVSLRPSEDDIWSVSGRGEMVMLHEQLIPVARLHRIFGLTGDPSNLTEALLVVVGEGSRKTALLVDELLGQQQFVVKPLTGQVADTPGVAGGAILGDGGVGLILDPEELIELARSSKSGRADAA